MVDKVVKPDAVPPGEEVPPHPALEALADQADRIGDEDPAAPGGQPAATIAITNASLIAGMVEAVAIMANIVFGLKSPGQVLTKDKATELGNLWGEVCDRRAITLSAVVGDWGDVVPAAIATLVVGEQLRTVLSAELAQRKADKAAAANAAAAAPGPAPAPAPAGPESGFVPPAADVHFGG